MQGGPRRAGFSARKKVRGGRRRSRPSTDKCRPTDRAAASTATTTYRRSAVHPDTNSPTPRQWWRAPPGAASVPGKDDAVLHNHFGTSAPRPVHFCTFVRLRCCRWGVPAALSMARDPATVLSLDVGSFAGPAGENPPGLFDVSWRGPILEEDVRGGRAPPAGRVKALRYLSVSDTG